MKPKKAPSSADAWDIPACEALIRDLWALRESMLRNEVRLASWLRQADATHTASATNLAHYLALRRHDLRSLQEQLARMGLSSLGRAETHVLANLDKVLGILHRLTGRPWTVVPRGTLSTPAPGGSQISPAMTASIADRAAGTQEGPVVVLHDDVRGLQLLPGQCAHQSIDSHSPHQSVVFTVGKPPTA